MRDRRFESARRKLHARLAVLELEHGRHCEAAHDWFIKRECVSCQTYVERHQMLREIIRELGGRA